MLVFSGVVVGFALGYFSRLVFLVGGIDLRLGLAGLIVAQGQIEVEVAALFDTPILAGCW